jgi:hypothetical protein
VSIYLRSGDYSLNDLRLICSIGAQYDQENKRVVWYHILFCLSDWWIDLPVIYTQLWCYRDRSKFIHAGTVPVRY